MTREMGIPMSWYSLIGCFVSTAPLQIRQSI